MFQHMYVIIYWQMVVRQLGKVHIAQLVRLQKILITTANTEVHEVMDLKNHMIMLLKVNF